MTIPDTANAASAAPVLSETARAKVNLTLRVLGRRVDGYHDLESVVAFADCSDRLTLTPGGGLALATSGPRGQECGETADNLVLKAARLFGERVADLTAGQFLLDKHLPVAAGIGGGSADAAAALRLLAKANYLTNDDPRLIETARATGADVPVCVPSHACVMSGVGESLTMLDLPPLACIMVNPRVAVATRDVFAGLGLRAGELRVGVGEMIEAVTLPKKGASAGTWVTQLAVGVNHLEAPALRIEPVIGEVLAALRAHEGVRFARMSGSGATCFAIYDDVATATEIAGHIAQAHPQWWVHAGTLG
jgi:4-diphosphocytidyl-2-C-methyl-D-erythritol kinase